MFKGHFAPSILAVSLLACSAGYSDSEGPSSDDDREGSETVSSETADGLSVESGEASEEQPSAELSGGEQSQQADSPTENEAEGEPSEAAESQETAAEASAEPASGTEESRKTSDGETIVVIVPEPAPVKEVPAGSTCGVYDAEGTLLSCQPGTYCLSPAEGVAGTCQVAPRAPRTDG